MGFVNVAELRAKGYLRVEAVFSVPELRQVSDLVDQMIERWIRGLTSHPDYWSFQRDDVDKDVLYRIHNLERHNPAFGALLNSEPLQTLVTAVMGEAVPTACALIYKMPGLAVQGPWHRDPIDVPPDTVYNFSVFLDDATADNGPLAFVPGTHVDGREFDGQRPSDAVDITAQAGDVIIHDVRVYHGSGGSRSAMPRRSIITEFQPSRLNPVSVMERPAAT